MKVAIVGGGIAGLATAWYVRKRAEETGQEVNLRIMDATMRFGGKIISSHQENCLLEGGPDSLLTEKPWALDLVRELGLEQELLPSNDSQRSFSILHNGALHPFPAGCRLFIPQKVTPMLTTKLLSFPGRLRMLREPFHRKPPPDGDESLADFTRRHFGQEALDRLAGPLLGGIYGGDPEDMSMRATFPRLLSLEAKHGSLILGMRGMMKQAKTQQRQGRAPSLFTSLKGGMQVLPDALAARLSEHLEPNHKVSRLERDGDQWRVDEETFDIVIIALPARAAAPLVAGVDSGLSGLLAQQTASSSATVSFVFDKKDLPGTPSGFGFMSAHPLTSLLVGCTWTGNKFNGREGDRKFVCRAFIGGPHAEEAIRTEDDETVMRRTLDALRAICPFVPDSPLSTWVQRWPDANPSYRVGHLDWVADLRKHTDALPGLHLTGSSYEGISVSDCVRQGQETAEKIFSGLGN